MIRVLLADDHRVLRDGLKSLLAEEPEMEVVGEASNGIEAIEKTGEVGPDVVILDIGMPLMNGIQAAKKLNQLYPGVRILILTQYDSEEYLVAVLDAGALGYVLKDTAGSELIEAIRTVHQGLPYLSPAMTRLLIQDHIKRKDLVPNPVNMLTPREYEIFHLLAEGYSNHEIAEKLYISIKTVQTHRTHIMEKLSLNNRTDLVKYAIRRGIISV